MQFIDEARFVVRGGRGGDGGSVRVRATEDLSTLEPYAYRNLVRAERGRHGSGNNRAGERGEDVTLEVPVGTVILDADGVIADLSEAGASVVVAAGGEGGRGNGSFATSTRQAPAFRERGLPGEEREIRLELRVLSDVGLVGLPNAGKSSLLGALSAAHPKVGAYPFTTLTPHLGVVDEKTYREPFVVADIPGLIEGASEGRGLGNRFLRHVARARLLALVLDASEDPEGAEGTLRAELYGAGLAEKPSLLVLNKVDLLDEELRDYLRETFPGALHVSAVTGEGVAGLRDAFESRLRDLTTEEAAATHEPEHRVFRPGPRGLRVEREGEVYAVYGDEVQRFALKTDWESQEGVEHFQRELERRGVTAALRRAGAEPGDDVRIGPVEFEYR